VEKAKAKKVRKIKIQTVKNVRTTKHDVFWCFYIMLSAGKIKLKMHEYKTRAGGVTGTAFAKGAIRYKKEYLEKAVEIAEKLLNLGFEVTIDNKNVSEARKDIIELEKKRQNII